MIKTKLACGEVGALRRSGRGEGTAEEKNRDNAEAEAKENAARDAFRNGLRAAAKVASQECPLACPAKVIEIVVDGPETDGPERSATEGMWKCDATAAWHLRIICLEKVALKGDEALPGSEADPKPLNCGKPVKRAGKADGKAISVSPKSAAAKTACMFAENRAYHEVEAQFRLFTCRKSTCPDRKVRMKIGPAKVTVGPAATTQEGVWDPDSLFDCEAECAWTLVFECQGS
jgi:hypothetical protein